MADEKIFQSRIQLKHDIEENWLKATNFIPKNGEIIIYDIDENNSIARFKIGDGITNVNSLPFASHHEVISYLPQDLTEEQKAQARENIGAGTLQTQADYSQSDETAVDYIKNRTHYEETSLIDITGLEYEKSVYSSKSSYDFSLPLELGQVWNIWHDSSSSGNPSLRYENLEVQEDDNGELYIGDLDCKLIPFYIQKEKLVFSTNFVQGIQPSIFKAVGVSGAYVGGHIVHQLDPKYIKDMYYEIPEKWLQVEFTEPLRGEISTTMFVSNSYAWAIDKTYRIRVDDEEYVFEGMNSFGWSNIFGANVYYIGEKWYALNSNMNWSDYPFSFVTADFTNIYVVFEDGTINHTVELFEADAEIKYLDPKYIKDMYFEDTKKTDISGATYIVDITASTVQIENAIPLELGQTWSSYRMYRDSGVWSEYRTFEVKQADDGVFYIGDPSLTDNEGGAVIYLTSNELITPDGMVSQGYSAFKFVCDSGYVSQKQIKHIDPKYIKDMYYEIPEVVTALEISSGGITYPWELDKTYTLCVDGVKYQFDGFKFGFYHSASGYNIIYLGEKVTGVSGPSNWSEYPFSIYGPENYILYPESHVGDTLNIKFADGTLNHTVEIIEEEKKIKYLDIKYLPIMKEDKGLAVLEINNFINSTEHYDESLKILLGKYSVTVDDKSYTLFFNAIEDFSMAVNEIIYIETWNGGIYIKFADGNTHSVKIEKIIDVIDDKYLPESAKVQPDWNQNDENAPDYIKNRTHYITEKLTLLREPLTLNCDKFDTLTFVNENNEAVKIGCYYGEAYAYWLGWDYLKGQTIRIIFDNEPYDVLIEDNSIGYLTKFPFYIYNVSDRFRVCALEQGTHTLEFYSINHEFKQLDPRYVGTDWSQNDENAPGYIKNRPHYEDIIDGVIVPNATYYVGGTQGFMFVGDKYDFKMPIAGKTYQIAYGDIVTTKVAYTNSNDGYVYLGDNWNEFIMRFGINTVHAKVDIYIETASAGEKTISVTGAYINKIYQLDEKYIPTATSDDIIQMLVETEMISPATDENENLLTDENRSILVY